MQEEPVDRIYQAYPTRCPTNRRATGKSAKDKLRIKRLLREHQADELVLLIELYVADCRKHSTWIMNFSKFLNNLPDKETFLPRHKVIITPTTAPPPPEDRGERLASFAEMDKILKSVNIRKVK